MRLVVRHLDLESQERRRKDLSLRIGLERQRPSAVERAVQKEIERVQVRQFKAFDRARDHSAEVLRHVLHCQLTDEHWIPFRPQRDDADVCRVALIARARVSESQELDFHAMISTAGLTTVLSISAGQYATISSTLGRADRQDCR